MTYPAYDGQGAQSKGHTGVAPLLPLRAATCGEILIDRCQTVTSEWDQSAYLDTVHSKFTIEHRWLCPIDVETSDYDASQESGQQLTDVGTGHYGQVECAWTLSKCTKAEKDADIQKTTKDTTDENGNAHVNR
jgi:hypothetical protein